MMLDVELFNLRIVGIFQKELIIIVLEVILKKLLKKTFVFKIRSQCEVKNNFLCFMGRVIKRDLFDDRI